MVVPGQAGVSPAASCKSSTRAEPYLRHHARAAFLRAALLEGAYRQRVGAKRYHADCPALLTGGRPDHASQQIAHTTLTTCIVCQFSSCEGESLLLARAHRQISS